MRLNGTELSIFFFRPFQGGILFAFEYKKEKKLAKVLKNRKGTLKMKKCFRNFKIKLYILLFNSN